MSDDSQKNNTNSNSTVIDRTEALGHSSIKKLLVEYAGPAIVAMTASSLYNMVDSIFIGQGVGPLAISGLALTFPVMNLSAAFGAMIGVGASTLLSVKLGEGDKVTAKRVLGNVINLNVLLGLVFMAVMLYFLDPILYFFGASKDTIVYAKEYLTIILYGNVITHTYLGLNATLRSAGHPHKAMILTIVTVVLNTILDPIFIYPLKMGIAGAAWATVIAQSVPLISLIIHFCNKRELIHFSKDIFIPRWNIVKDTIAIGLSPLSMQAAACCVVIIINKSLKFYGGADGDLAIGGYNYGATKYERVKQAFKYTVYIGTVFATLFFVVAEVFPEFAVKVFTNEPRLIELSVYGLRVSSVFFPILGFQIVSTALFQSLGLAKTSIFLSLTRQVIFLIPFLLTLPKFWGLTGVWFSMPASDITTCIITFFMIRRLFRRFKKQEQKSNASANL